MTKFEDKIFANIIQFLLDGNETDAASLLLSCRFNVNDEPGQVSFPNESRPTIDVYDARFTCPRTAYDVLTDNHHHITKSIKRAIGAVNTNDEGFGINDKFEVVIDLIDIRTDWQENILEIIRNKAHVETDGGAIIQGNVYAGRDVIGRDKFETHIYPQPKIDIEFLRMKKKLLEKAMERIRKERQNFVTLSQDTPKVFSSNSHRRAVEEYSWECLKEDVEHLHLSEMTPDTNLTDELLQAIDGRNAKLVLKLSDELSGKLNVTIKQIPL